MAVVYLGSVVSMATILDTTTFALHLQPHYLLFTIQRDISFISLFVDRGNEEAVSSEL